MSKNFEKEYKELAQNEIPDLWDRIEAGLKEKSAPENSTKNKTKIMVIFKRYAGLAAAILCVAIIIPASILISQSGGKSYTSEAYDTAIDEATYDVAEAAEEAAEAETDESTEAAGTETDEGTEVAGIKEAATEMYDTSEESSAEEMNREAAVAESESYADAAAGVAEDLMSDKEEQKQAENSVIENVIVQVTTENNDVYGEGGKPLGGTVYTVIICKDASGTFKEGEQIEIYLPVYSSVLMTVGDKFDIDIACRDDGEYQYVVDQIYLQKE